MRLQRLLAATLAALFVVGCSSEKSTPPSPKIQASTGPQEKPPVKPSHGAADPAPPPKTAPLSGAAGSPPSEHQDLATDTDTDTDTETESDKPPERPDPLAGISLEYRPYYEQLADLIVPLANLGKDVAKAAFSPQFSEREERQFVVVKLGEYTFPPTREVETGLRTLFTNVNDRELESQRYLDAVDSFLAGKEKADMLVAAYERMTDEGSDFPADVRTELADLIRFPREAPSPFHYHVPEGENNSLADSLRTKLLKRNVWANDVFTLYVPIHKRGLTVIRSRQWCRMFHDLLAALPEPHRSKILMRLAWSPEQEAKLKEEWEKLMHVEVPYRRIPERIRRTLVVDQGEYLAMQQKMYLEDLEAFAAEQRSKFLALEQAKRDTIEGRFPKVDAAGWHALLALDKLIVRVQNSLNKELSRLGYHLEPLIPHGTPQDDASNVLSKIPLPGSAKDRVPTMWISGSTLVYDAPAGQISYADLIKPGNVLIGTLRVQERDRETTYQAELHIAAIVTRGPSLLGNKYDVVQGKLLVIAPDGYLERIPFKGEFASTSFTFTAPWKLFGYDQLTTFTCGLDKKGLTGDMKNRQSVVGSFSLSLKK